MIIVQGKIINLFRLQTVLVIVTKPSFLYYNINYESKARSRRKLNKASGQAHIKMTISMLQLNNKSVMG